MKIFYNKNKLIKYTQRQKNIGFVPTMGAIHAGHISLIKKSLKECDKTIVSIFVNKPQFNKQKDYNKYPRNLKSDILKLKKSKVDFLYIPTNKEIYPKNPNKNIQISKFKKKLCGKFRKNHFEAVVDVLERFVKIIGPKKMYLGEKDMQQLIIVKEFFKNKNTKIMIVPCKTIREKNGMAYSSRNFLLSKKDKKIAGKVFRYMKSKKKNLIKNKSLISKIKKIIYSFGVKKIDYIEVININEYFNFYKTHKKFRIFIAYHLKSIRLIDNF
jgi:pantoate--beta-alanine ligase